MLGSLLVLALLTRTAAKLDVEVDDNSVKETPLVECMSERIQMNIRTLNHFKGRIYLKVHPDSLTSSCWWRFVTDVAVCVE